MNCQCTKDAKVKEDIYKTAQESCCDVDYGDSVVKDKGQKWRWQL